MGDEWYERAAKLEKQIRRLQKQTTDFESVRSTINALREIYQGAFVNHRILATERQTEQSIWKHVFYRTIEHHRSCIKLLSSVIHAVIPVDNRGGRVSVASSNKTVERRQIAAVQQAQRQFTQALDDMSLYFDSLLNDSLEAALVSRQRSLLVDLIVDTDIIEPAVLLNAQAALSTSYHLYIYLGDLERYRQLNLDEPLRKWGRAVQFYQAALQLLPENGNPHNQLAVVATYTGNDISAIYRYLRALCLAHPFATARDNLRLLFESNRMLLCEALVTDGTDGEPTQLNLLVSTVSNISQLDQLARYLKNEKHMHLKHTYQWLVRLLGMVFETATAPQVARNGEETVITSSISSHKLDIGLFANLGGALLSSLQKLMFLPMAEHAARIGGAVAMHPDFDRFASWVSEISVAVMCTLYQTNLASATSVNVPDSTSAIIQDPSLLVHSDPSRLLCVWLYEFMTLCMLSSFSALNRSLLPVLCCFCVWLQRMPTARLPLVCHSADDVNSAQASLYGGAQRQSSVSNVFAQLLNSDKNSLLTSDYWDSSIVVTADTLTRLEHFAVRRFAAALAGILNQNTFDVTMSNASPTTLGGALSSSPTSLALPLPDEVELRGLVFLHDPYSNMTGVISPTTDFASRRRANTLRSASPVVSSIGVDPLKRRLACVRDFADSMGTAMHCDSVTRKYSLIDVPANLVAAVSQAAVLSLGTTQSYPPSGVTAHVASLVAATGSAPRVSVTGSPMQASSLAVQQFASLIQSFSQSVAFPVLISSASSSLMPAPVVSDCDALGGLVHVASTTVAGHPSPRHLLGSLTADVGIPLSSLSATPLFESYDSTALPDIYDVDSSAQIDFADLAQQIYGSDEDDDDSKSPDCATILEVAGKVERVSESPLVFAPTNPLPYSAPLIRAVTQALLKTLADPAGDILPKVALENEDYNEDDEGDTVVFQPRGATQAIPLLAAPMANVLPNTLIRSVTAIAKPSDKSPFSSWNSDTSGESHGDLFQQQQLIQLLASVRPHAPVPVTTTVCVSDDRVVWSSLHQNSALATLNDGSQSLHHTATPTNTIASAQTVQGSTICVAPLLTPPIYPSTTTHQQAMLQQRVICGSSGYPYGVLPPVIPPFISYFGLQPMITPYGMVAPYCQQQAPTPQQLVILQLQQQVQMQQQLVGRQLSNLLSPMTDVGMNASGTTTDSLPLYSPFSASYIAATSTAPPCSSSSPWSAPPK